MKSTACLFSSATALARVFLTSAGPRQTGLLAGSSRSYRYGHNYSTSHGSGVLVPQFLVPRGSDSLISAALHIPRQQLSISSQRRCLHQRGPPTRRPPSGGAGRPSGPPRSNPAFRSPMPPRPGPPRPGPPRPVNSGGGGGAGMYRPRPTVGGGGGGGGGGAGGGNKGVKGTTTHVKYKLGRLPRDDEITHSHVILKQADGTISEPQPTAGVLLKLNPRTESLVVLAMPQSAPAPDEDGDRTVTKTDAQSRRRFPICHIVDRVAERKLLADRAKDERKKSVARKELELNWAISPHDLGHRLIKLREFLEKGMYVEVSLQRKAKSKGKRQATREEADEVMRRIRETVAEVPGAKEIKIMEGEILRNAKLFLEGGAEKE